LIGTLGGDLGGFYACFFSGALIGSIAIAGYSLTGALAQSFSGESYGSFSAGPLLG